jgi:hypothetical protein
MSWSPANPYLKEATCIKRKLPKIVNIAFLLEAGVPVYKLLHNGKKSSENEGTTPLQNVGKLPLDTAHHSSRLESSPASLCEPQSSQPATVAPILLIISENGITETVNKFIKRKLSDN